MSPVPTRILIVEDEPDIRNTLELILAHKGFTVLTSSNGHEALRVLESEGLPSLVLLDMRMPVMNGWEFAKAFRKVYGDSVPFLMMTAASDARSRADEVGAAAWLAKPFEPSELMDKIKSLTDSGH